MTTRDTNSNSSGSGRRQLKFLTTDFNKSKNFASFCFTEKGIEGESQNIIHVFQFIWLQHRQKEKPSLLFSILLSFLLFLFLFFFILEGD